MIFRPSENNSMELQPIKKQIIKGTYPKFRVWDGEKQKFYYSGQTLIVSSDGKSVIVPFAIPLDYMVPQEFEVKITEFTGILESTPVLTPIYTGDIVLTTKDGRAPVDEKVVAWLPEFACFNVSLDLINKLHIVIVGNVFETPKVTKPSLDLSGDVNKAVNDTKKLPN